MSSLSIFSVLRNGRHAASSANSFRNGARGMKILSAAVVNNGKQVDVTFQDNSVYRFHSEWMQDSSPSIVGADFYRKSAKLLFEMQGCTAESARASDDGSKVLIDFAGGNETVREEYVSSWLHAFAPHVGQPIDSAAKIKAASSQRDISGTGSLFDDVTRKAWKADVDIPLFDATQLIEERSEQIRFLEAIAEMGVARIDNVERPPSLDQLEVGQPLENLGAKVIGRLNQHPVRQTRYGVMKTEGMPAAGADYDHKNMLSMHTDHSVYHGTPGFVQVLYQAEGTVTSKVCDGYALAEYMRINHPREYELLTTVSITHSSRNCLYTPDGDYRAPGSSLPSAPFELVHTHPVITLDSKGNFEKVVQSETKRGVSALKYDVYDEFMEAYRLWAQIVEDDAFVRHFTWPENSIVVTNNYRVLHGRASVPPGMPRTMTFGYFMKASVENRYRFLKQMEVESREGDLDAKWLTRVPNQVLSTMVE